MNLKIQFVEMTFPPADAPCSNSFQKIKTVRQMGILNITSKCLIWTTNISPPMKLSSSVLLVVDTTFCQLTMGRHVCCQ